MSKLSRRNFMRHFGNAKISLQGLRSDRNMDQSKVRKLAPADLNRDGFIHGREEMGQLVSQLSWVSGSENHSEIKVDAAPRSLLGLLTDVVGKEGATSTATRPTGGNNRPTRPTRTTDVQAGQIQARRKEALIGQLVKAGGSATREDAALLAKELRAMPVQVLESMVSRGVKIVAARGNVTDYLTHLRGVRPRGYPPGHTWDTVTGGYDSGRREVVVATASRNGRRVLPPRASVNVVLHEAAHSYDHAQGRPSQNDPAFATARQRDLRRLASMTSYFTQPGDAGKNESFAESLAMFIEEPRTMKRKLPNLYQYWARKFPNG